MKTGKTDQELKTFLKKYDPDKYEKPSVTTDVVIFAIDDEAVRNKRKNAIVHLQVLLVKRRNHPYKDHWALPGGFVPIGEGLEVSAKRELREETNVQDIYIEQLYTWGDDTRRDPRMRVISVSYLALIDKRAQNILASDDAQDVKWFTIKAATEAEQSAGRRTVTTRYCLTSEDGVDTVTFDVCKRITRHKATQTKTASQCNGNDTPIGFDHGKIIDYAIERLRNKIHYTPIAFNLVPEVFTWSYLQAAYEAILDTPLIASNFRRKMQGFVEETGAFEAGKQMRPAKLYRQKLNWDSWE